MPRKGPCEGPRCVRHALTRVACHAWGSALSQRSVPIEDWGLQLHVGPGWPLLLVAVHGTPVYSGSRGGQHQQKGRLRVDTNAEGPAQASGMWISRICCRLLRVLHSCALQPWTQGSHLLLRLPSFTLAGLRGLGGGPEAREASINCCTWSEYASATLSLGGGRRPCGTLCGAAVLCIDGDIQLLEELLVEGFVDMCPEVQVVGMK